MPRVNSLLLWILLGFEFGLSCQIQAYGGRVRPIRGDQDTVLPPYIEFDADPDGKSLVVSEGHRLYLVSIVSRSSKIIHVDTGTVGSPAFQNNTASVLFSRQESATGPSSIGRCDVLNRSVVWITHDRGMFDDAPTPDNRGNGVVFRRAVQRLRLSDFGGSPWTGWDLYAADADGKRLRRLTRLSAVQLSAPSVSQDGTHVLYTVRRPFKPGEAMDEFEDVYIQRVDGEATTRVTRDRNASFPSFSPDGKHVAYVSDRQTRFQYDLHVLDIDRGLGTALHVTSKTRMNRKPRFISQGHSLLFLGDMPEKGESSSAILWRVNTDGSNLRKVARFDVNAVSGSMAVQFFK